MARKKVTIVGAGMTGGSMVQRLAERNICDVVVQDVPEFQHHGKALDIMQSAPVLGFESNVIATDGWEETANSDVVILTAGVPRKPGMSREDLLNANADIVGDKAKNAAKHSPNAVIIVFANPMDAMCHVARSASGFPRERIIGQGGMLDTLRFRTFLSMELGVSPRDVHAYVLGGHTDTTMVPVVSQARVGGIPLTSLLPKERIEAIVERTMKGGAELVALYKTGSAYFAPSAATIAMTEAILLDERRLMPCSVFMQGEYGVNGVFCGTIVQLGEGGIRKVFEVPVSDEERAAIIKAAEATKELVGVLGLGAPA